MNRALFAAGATCLCVGVAQLAGVGRPSLPGGAYGFLAVALLATTVAAVALYRDSRSDASPDRAAPPERARPRRPGAGATRTIDDLRVVGRRADEDDGRRELHDRLEALAVDVLVAKRDVDEATARERLASGAWTDDPTAAACFVDGPVPALAAGEHLAALRSGDPPYARRVRRALAELDRVEADA